MPEEKDTMLCTDAIVIGGGLSGLCAARKLSQNDLQVIVLEANDRVGGRTCTRKNKDVKYVDVGGAYVCPGQNHILKLAEQLGVKTYQVFEEGHCICFAGGSRTLYKLGRPIFFWNILTTLDLNNFSREFDRLSRKIPLKNPWTCPYAEEWDKVTMKEFIDKTCWTTTVRSLAYIFVALNVTSEAHEISLLWFLWYIRQRGGVYRIYSSKNQGWKFIGGSQQICEKIAEELKEKVLLNKSVAVVDQTSDQVIVRTTDGSEYKARCVIVAMPPTMQSRLHVSPPLPPHRNQLQQRMPLGSVAKAILYYETPFWRKKGFNGSIVTSDAKHPCVYFLDDTKPDGTYPALIGFLAGNRLRKWMLLPESERKNVICESLKEILGSNDAFKVIHYEEKNWMSEPYCAGGYTSVFSPGVLTNYGWTLGKPVDRILFAGTETATLWSGYMDGAVSAGYRAAAQAVRVLKDSAYEDIDEEEDDDEDPRTFLERNAPSAKSLTIYSSTAFLIGALFLCYTSGSLTSKTYLRYFHF